ncbi:MAG TPA: glycosyltransferase family 2 protein [Methylomirabilota bacterium]|nr:glycosyltransferase family 2 protein [Methylomirabilota bacterium]
MSPLVSVIVTAYNHEAFIAEAVQSVLAQTYADYEVIVVDDGSSDGTVDQLSGFGHRIRLIRQLNRGVAGSRNAGIRHAQGELLAFLDGDDLWEPEKLRWQVAAAAQHPGSGLIAVDGVQFDGSVVRGQSLLATSITERLQGRASVTLRCYEQLLSDNLICTTSQVMVPRFVFDSVGLSDPAFPVSSDRDLYIRIAARYEMTFVGQRLTRWRYLHTSASGPDELRVMRWAIDDIAILKKHLRSAAPIHRPLIRNLIRQEVRKAASTAYYHGREIDRAMAARYLLGLLVANLPSVVPASFLAALYSPRVVTRAVSRAARRVLRLPL